MPTPRRRATAPRALPTNFRVALQLFTVRGELASDFARTLAKVTEIGYRAVELAGFGGLQAPELKDLLDAVGLQIAGAHVQIEDLDEDMGKEIEYCRAIGSPYVVVAGLPKERRNPDELGPFYNELGARCSDAGMRFAYHNHEWEFEGPPGGGFIDKILAATDPELVFLELDVYWAAYASVDPIGFLAEHGGRVRLIHLKDMTPDRGLADVGEGILKLDRVLAAGMESGVDWFIVENDEPKPSGLKSASRSFANLRAFCHDSDEVLAATFGAWKGRDEDGADYVDRLRSGLRER